MGGAGLFGDPVTGSASGGMMAYLLQYGLVEAGEHRLEHGDAVGRRGRVRVWVGWGEDGVVGPPKVGGEAVTVMRGVLEI